MEQDLLKYAERKMALFNLIVSLWQHNIVLEKTVGIGFTKSVFTHSMGTCDLYASQKEIKEITSMVLELIKKGDLSFKTWYEQAKALNKEADDLLIEYQGNNFKLDKEAYDRALQIFTNNFGFCTILPYWVLYAINQDIETGSSKETFGNVLKMYEELKSETRYPQLGQIVINKFFNKAADILKISPGLASCLHPDELGKALVGATSVSASELDKRMKWCAIIRADKEYDVNFIYDQNMYSKLLSSEVDENIKELKGGVAFKGIVRGRAKIVNTIYDMEKFEEGDVLISIQSSPSLMPAIIKSSAIVTDEGGIMCHASIISRELKKPCVIGTKVATKIFKDGDEVEVDAERGIVRIIK